MRKMTRGAQRCGLAAYLLVLTIAGCGDGVEPEPAVPTTVEISPDSVMLTFSGETQGFNAVVRDEDGKVMDVAVAWTSSDPGVFAVSGSGGVGTVTAVGNGAGTLTATAGQASGTASVTVVQTPARIEIVSGNDQEGLREQTLMEPLVISVVEQTGAPIPDYLVTFTPGERSGSVSQSEVTTDAGGMGSTEWTLGDLRSQELVAAAGELITTFRASALADPPIPDYTVAGRLEPSRFDPLVTETIEIKVHITNLGDGGGSGTFPMQFTVDGMPLETINVEPTGPGDTTTVTITAGPFASGDRRIGVMIDPEGEIEEWEEANNEANVLLTVVQQLEISLGDSVMVEAVDDMVLLYRLEITEPLDEVLTVRLTGPNGDGDLFVDFNDRPDVHYKYRCYSWEFGTGEYCQLFPVRAGTYNIAVHAYDAFDAATLVVTSGEEPIDPFDLELVFVDNGTDSQNAIITGVAERWESMIGSGSLSSLVFLSAGDCGPDSPAVAGELMDDFRLFVMIDSIDGAGGRVASSGPCHLRVSFGGLWLSTPAAGGLILDEADIAQLESQGVLESVVTHEMAHALGFSPNVWEAYGFLRNPSLPEHPDNDTHLDASLAVAAFNAAGGGGYAHGKVPLQNGAEPGISDRHWRQSVLGDELMTPYLTGDSHPLSRITLNALYEVGYEINVAMADAFTMTVAGVAGMALPRGRVIYLGNDIAPFRLHVTGKPVGGRGK